MGIDKRHIILASGSPRRLEILRGHGIEPEIVVPAVNEQELAATLPPGLSPQELAEQLALHKALAVFEQIREDTSRPPGTLILAADTLVCKEGVGILGKPCDRADALRMLQALCNTAHEVVTGVAVIELATGSLRCFADTTTVHFGEYGQSEIEEYLTSEPPYDKAGSYAIQGTWGKQVTLIEGDLENVIGLPYYRLADL